MAADDLPLDEDVAELNREAQRAVDRVIAARAELAASIENINAVRAKIADGSNAAVAFIDAYMNPTVPNPPEPVAPDVAAPPPAEEPPVYTTVDTITVEATNSSGGESVVDSALEVIATDAGLTEATTGDTAAE